MNVSFMQSGRQPLQADPFTPLVEVASEGPCALFDEAVLSAETLAQTLAMESRKIAEFTRLLASEGCTLDARRLVHDPVYAYKKMARAHCSENATLRSLSVELFEHYEQLELRRHIELRRGALWAASRH